MTTDSVRSLLDRYVVEVLVTGSESRDTHPVTPTPGSPPSPFDLRRVLADPRVLLATGEVDTRSELAALIRFAWLSTRWPAAATPLELASQMARFRFLVWSFPARLGMRASHDVFAGIRLPDAVTPEADVDVIQAQARAARQEWKRYLDGWEDDPWLAARQLDAPQRFEEDLRWLVTAWPSTTPPEGHNVPWPAGPAPLDLGSRADDQRVAGDIVERWLERGSVAGAASTLAPGNRWRGPLLAGYPVAASTVVALTLTGFAGVARWAAVVLLAAGLLAAVVVPVRYSPLGLLRIPAAAAVGLAVLVSLTSRWWISADGWMIGAALVAGAAGYLMLEARQHGADQRAAVRRGLLVTLIGLLHAAVLSIATLGFVVPAMAENGSCIAGWQAQDPWRPVTLSTSTQGLPPGSGSCATTLRAYHAAAPAGTLLLMAGWSLSFGLAAQILWDDRPVTAPLGRLRRVRGGS